MRSSTGHPIAVDRRLQQIGVGVGQDRQPPAASRAARSAQPVPRGTRARSAASSARHRLRPLGPTGLGLGDIRQASRPSPGGKRCPGPPAPRARSACRRARSVRVLGSGHSRASGRADAAQPVDEGAVAVEGRPAIAHFGSLQAGERPGLPPRVPTGGPSRRAGVWIGARRPARPSAPPAPAATRVPPRRRIARPRHAPASRPRAAWRRARRAWLAFSVRMSSATSCASSISSRTSWSISNATASE